MKHIHVAMQPTPTTIHLQTLPFPQKLYSNRDFLFFLPMATILLPVSMNQLLQGPLISAITQHLSIISHSRMSSWSIHVVARIRIPFFFKAEEHSLPWTKLQGLSICWLMMVSTPRLLWTVQLWTWFTNSCLNPCFQLFGDIYLEVELPDHMLILCLIFWGFFSLTKAQYTSRKWK